MPRQSKKTPEGYVKAAICDYLAVERIYFLRTNAGTTVVPATEKSNRRVLQMAPAGTADILALPHRIAGTVNLFQPCWIECKAPGNKQSPAQRAFERERICDGHAYIVAYSIEDVAEWLYRFRNYKP